MSGSREHDREGKQPGVAALGQGEPKTDANIEPLIEPDDAPAQPAPQAPAVAAQPTKPPPPRGSSRSIPPPMPPATRKTRDGIVPPKAAPAPVTATLITAQPEVPTVVERALASLPDAGKARADRLAKELEQTAATDRVRAAAIAYELGELFERKLQTEERAIVAYRRSFELDASLRPNRWALRRVLYRRALWPELEKVIDVEIKRAGDDAERVDLLFERALVSGRRKGTDEQVRTALVGATQLAPHHHGVLLELERVHARMRDRARLVDVWERLAEALDQPQRKIAYWVEVARGCAASDYARASRAIEIATQLAMSEEPSLVHRVARERLRIADAYGPPADSVTALEVLAQSLAAALATAGTGERRTGSIWLRELAAVRRRQAQLARGTHPVQAWDLLQEAQSLCPDEPVVLADLLELAAELGRYKELLVLVHSWRGAEDEVGRARMLAAWCADARTSAERRQQSRALLGALTVTAPGFILLTAAAECEALAADPAQAPLDLATTYLEAARAAAAGTWVGPGKPPQPDSSAAAALYIQAADLLAYYVATPGALEQARDALGKALEVVTGHPAALEALIELDDVTGHAPQALARCSDMARAAPADRTIVERALRVAINHDVTSEVIALQQRIIILDSNDHWAAWGLESTLGLLGRDEERTGLLATLARIEAEPARRRAAMLGAARLHERAGASDKALALYRELLPMHPQDAFLRDAYSELLRSEQRWEELANERRDQARTLADGQRLLSALREAAWLLEIRLDDPARAVDVYEEWLARFPADRMALEGIARCRAALRDPVREVDARAEIARIDETAEAQWLYARSLERAGRYVQAMEQYRGLLARDETSVAVANAALALGDLAGTGTNIAIRVEAAESLAKRTTDTQLGAALREQCGWMHLIALADGDRAAQSFAAALAIRPDRPGALLGSALVASRAQDRNAQTTAFAALAAGLPPSPSSSRLRLRAAASASAAGDSELASELIESARAGAPDDVTALFVAAEASPRLRIDTTDQAAAAERMLARADLLAKRGAYSEDPADRATWALDRADALEAAGRPRDAIEIIATVLDSQPENRRAVLAVRRIALAANDHVAWAQASYTLARVSRGRPLRLRLLREAASVYDRPGPTQNIDYARTIYSAVVALDPGGPEADRLLELVREAGDPGELINALTDQLTRLAAVRKHEEYLMLPLLLERATLLRALGRTEQAAADLDAVLSQSPNHVEALRLRGDVAAESGDLQGAVASWQRFLAIETPGPRRTETEAQLAKALDKIEALIPPPSPSGARLEAPGSRSFEDENGLAWEMEFTDPDAPVPTPQVGSGSSTSRPIRQSSHVIRRGTSTTAEQRVVVPPPASDPFGGKTATADLSALQEEERRLARLSAPVPAFDSGRAGDAPQQTTTAAALSGQQSITDVPGASMVTVADIPSLRAADDEKTDTTPPALHLPAVTRSQDAVVPEPVIDARGIRFPDGRAQPADDSAAGLLSIDRLRPGKEAADETLGDTERELPIVDSPAAALVLRLEAGRLAEVSGQVERARGHYDAALALEPRALQALRGLRRIAWHRGDVAEAARLLELELAACGAGERTALEQYRLHLLLAAGELETARAAIDAVHQRVPSDPAALFADFEVSIAGDRAKGLDRVLEQAAPLVDAELRGALLCARGVLAARDADNSAAGSWFTAAAEADPSSLAMRLEAIRDAAARAQGGAGTALLELAYQVEREDPLVAAALAVRSQSWIGSDGGRDTLADAAKLAAGATPRDPLVGRIAAETALLVEEPAQASHAFARWGRCKSVPVERAFAAARAAELDPARLGRLWAQVLELEPGDDYAAARLRGALVTAGAVDQVLELDLDLARIAQRDVPLLRASRELVRQNRTDEAIELLLKAREQRPASWAIAEGLADAYGSVNRWSDRARVLGDLVNEPGLLASDVVRLRSALAWDKAARAVGPNTSRDERERASTVALDAWNQVLADDPRSVIGHAAAIAHASNLEDRAILIRVLARARGAERSPWGASSLSLRYGRLLLTSNPRLAQTVARDVAPTLDDPRCALARMMAAAHRRELGEAVTALEERANQRESKAGAAGAGHEPAMLRLRAAHLALDAGELPRARLLLARVDTALPGLVDDLLEVARQRLGEPAPTGPRTRATADGFARSLRDGDLAARRGDNPIALHHYQRAHALKPADPFVAAPLTRIAYKLRAPAPLSALAREQLRIAEQTGDTAARADAHELTARAEELGGDATAMQAALERAIEADPARLDLVHQLACEHAASGQHGKLRALRMMELAALEGSAANQTERDRVAMLFDTATLCIHDKRPDSELGALYRGVLELDPANRLAMFHLDGVLRRSGAMEQVAMLEDHIARAFADPHTQATFLTRAGETLAELGKRSEAVQRFARAVELVPDHVPALEAWYETALAGELWPELAEAATRMANREDTPTQVAALHHLAGVALMDKARARDLAVSAFRRALDADPGYLDALLRLRILVEHTPDREHYAAQLRRRLESETDRGARVELDRMLAEHYRNTGQRDEAIRHYRAMLAADPADVRAHAAIADASSEQSDWRAVADAVIARIPLERDVQVLRTLNHRLGVLLTDHDVPEALKAFQRALTYRPDDEDTLVRLTDLAISAGEWNIAVGACDRLVTTERDPDKLAAHLHRAATIFLRGFADRERAERMLSLAVDSAPTSTEILRAVVQFYRESGDRDAMRGQLDRISDLMRGRIERDVRDGAAYRMMSRTVSARAEVASNGSTSAGSALFQLSRASAELAQLLGTAGDPELRLVSDDSPGDLSRLVGPGADEDLFAGAGEPAVRELFRRFAEPIAKHVGVELGIHGVGRKDRLRAQHPVAMIARTIATSLGFKDVELYVSTRHPYAMVAEPTNPVSLVVGEAIANGNVHGVRFASGAALKLAQLSLAIPARLPAGELGVLALALLRLFYADLPTSSTDSEAVQAHAHKLRRFVSTSGDRPDISLASFSPHVLVRDLKIAGLRAGLAASGSLVASLSLVAGAVGSNLQSVLTDPLGRELIAFALREPRTRAEPG